MACRREELKVSLVEHVRRSAFIFLLSCILWSLSVVLAQAQLCNGDRALVGQGVRSRPANIRPALPFLAHPQEFLIAHDPSEVCGVVSTPGIASLDASFERGDFNTAEDNAANTAFEISGIVNARPEEWFVAVDVLRSASSNPAFESNWAYNVATFEHVTRTSSGEFPFVFQATSVPPFEGVRPFEHFPDAWRPGGLGRLRVVVAKRDDPNQWAILPALAVGRFPANKYTIVLGDSRPDPTRPPGTSLEVIQNAQNNKTPDYLSVNNRVKSFCHSKTRSNCMRHAAIIALSRLEPTGEDRRLRKVCRRWTLSSGDISEPSSVNILLTYAQRWPLTSTRATWALAGRCIAYCAPTPASSLATSRTMRELRRTGS